MALGSNRIANSNFGTDDGWSEDGGSIVNGRIQFDGPDGNNLVQTSVTGLEVGHFYRTHWLQEVEDCSVRAMFPSLGADHPDSGYAFDDFEAEDTTQTLTFRGYGSGTGWIDAVMVQEVLAE